MHESIELQRISAEEAKKAEEKRKELRREQGRAQTFEQLVKLAKDRGYKNPVYYARMVMQGRRK